MLKKDITRLEKELSELQLLKERVKESLSKGPEGILRCELLHGKYPQYYFRNEENQKEYPKGRYLKKDERDLARDLAQRDYDQEFLKHVYRKEIILKNKIKEYTSIELKDVYQNLIEARRVLVTPYIMSDEDFLSTWFKSDLNISNGIPFNNEYVTERGELVRSKSEKMIADKLFYEKIPYKYESALKMNSGELIFPDFTVLNMRTRKTYYLEHFGMMDNSDYCKKALDKIDLYEHNNYYLGERLFATFESSQKGINMRLINDLINRKFK